jgi:hypothetical protein
MSPVEQSRRGRPALSPRQDQQNFDPVTGEIERPRELIRVDSIPTPPSVESRGPADTRVSINLEEKILSILKEEMDDLAVRLKTYGVVLDTRVQQELVDLAMAMLGGGFQTGGGAIRSR